MSSPVHVLTRGVPDSFERAQVTFVERVRLDLPLARAQHAGYEEALTGLGATLERLPAPVDLPDAPFIEDVLVVAPPAMVVCNPGAPSRSSEVAGVSDALEGRLRFFALPEGLRLDGGDVVRWGSEIRVGVGGRSDPEAVPHLHALLAPFGYRVRGLALKGCLHLKTAATLPAPGRLLVNEQWLDVDAGQLDPDGVWRHNEVPFPGLQLQPVDPREPWGANTLPVGGRVLLPAEHPRTTGLLETLGLRPYPISLGEFLKAEAGVTCLSVVIPSELFLEGARPTP